jgi:hypothetical protein
MEVEMTTSAEAHRGGDVDRRSATTGLKPFDPAA